MTYQKRFHFLSVLSAAVIAIPAFAAASPKDIVSSLITTFVQWNGTSTDKAKLDQLARAMDYEGMSERALGAAQWSKLSPTQKTAFIAALRNAIEQRYYPRWHRLFTKGTVAYSEQSKSQSDIVLPTTLTVGKSKQSLSWLLNQKGSELKVVSLKVDKSDLVTRLHDRLSPRLAKSGFDKVLAWLQSKSADVGESASADSK